MTTTRRLMSGEHVGTEVANYRGVTVKVPQNEIVMVGFWDGDCPEAAGPDEPPADRGVGGVGFNAIEPFVNVRRESGVRLVELRQLVVGLGIHFQHTPIIPQCPNRPNAPIERLGQGGLSLTIWNPW